MSKTTAKTAINRSQSFSLAEKRTLRELVDQMSDASAIADASEAHALSATYDDAEVEAALDALGAKINAILAALD